MPISLTKDELIAVVSGTGNSSQEKISFRAVEYASKEVKGGELFVALKGETTHGHKYIDDAFSRGAALCLVEDPQLLKSHPENHRLVYVSDTLAAFSALAKWWREKLGLKVLAVTGSVGKTTVKEMCAAILLKHSRGVYSQKSHNNHVGVPYTILRCDGEHKWAVLEMGMNHPGELKNLSLIGTPEVAVVTCIAPAHIGNFSGLSDIVDAKLEIVSGLKPSGTLIVNGNDKPLLDGVARLGKVPFKILKFGEAEKFDLAVTKLTTKGLEGLTIDLQFASGENLSSDVPMVGKHNGHNIAAAVLATRTLIPELSSDQICAGLKSFTAPLMRLNITVLNDKQRIIDDSYNANPVSMRAVLEIAKGLMSEGKRIGLILGEMRELGAFSEQYHREVGKLVAELKPLFLIHVGDDARYMGEEARSAGIKCFDGQNAEAAAHIARKLDFDILIIKGSRAVGLDRTVGLLLG